MAVVQDDPLARMRAFISEKPEQLKQQLNGWTAKQPAWVEGVVTGLTGSMQVNFGWAAAGAGAMQWERAGKSYCLRPALLHKARCAAGRRCLPRVGWCSRAAPLDGWLAAASLATAALPVAGPPPAPVSPAAAVIILLTFCPLCLQGAFLGVVMGSVGRMNVDAAAASALGLGAGVRGRPGVPLFAGLAIRLGAEPFAFQGAYCFAGSLVFPWLPNLLFLRELAVVQVTCSAWLPSFSFLVTSSCATMAGAERPPSCLMSPAAGGSPLAPQMLKMGGPVVQVRPWLSGNREPFLLRVCMRTAKPAVH